MDEPRGRWLDLDGWARRPTFDFFRGYEQPFFNLCAELDASATWERCRRDGLPFSLATWFLCLRAADGVEPLRYRLRGERVWVHEALGIATTILLDDGSFRFSRIGRADTFAAFVAAARAARERVSDPGAGTGADDVIHGTVIPWVRFTSISHARRLPAADSVPKVAVGRCSQAGAEWRLPVSVEVHHALVDGVHVGRFLEGWQAALAAPGEALDVEA